MQFIFIDENGNAGDSEWFWLAGIALDEEAVARFPELIYEPFDAFESSFLRTETLKILRRNDVYPPSTRREMSNRLYTHLEETIDYTIFSVGMHQSELDELKDPGRIYQFAFTMLLERFDWYLERECDGDYGCVFIDTTSQIEGVQREHERIRRIGSAYKEIKYAITIGAPLRDEFSPGIQLADLIVSGIQAHFIKAFDHFYKSYYLPHMYCRRDGKIEGYGVKIHPDSSYDELAFDPNRREFD